MIVNALYLLLHRYWIRKGVGAEMDITKNQQLEHKMIFFIFIFFHFLGEKKYIIIEMIYIFC